MRMLGLKMGVATIRSRIETLIATARLLEHADANASLVGAAQYRNLSRLVQSLLGEDVPDDALRAVLRAFPATAMLYENLHYDRSGLSQSPLEGAVSAELLASEVIERLRAGCATHRLIRPDDSQPAA